METIKTVEEFCERVKNKLSVNRFDFKIGFEWNEENSKKLKTIIADLHSANLSSANLSSADLSSADLRSADLSSADLSYADLRYANLSYANLRSAKGEFTFNFGVKLKVITGVKNVQPKT